VSRGGRGGLCPARREGPRGMGSGRTGRRGLCGPVDIRGTELPCVAPWVLRAAAVACCGCCMLRLLHVAAVACCGWLRCVSTHWQRAPRVDDGTEQAVNPTLSPLSLPPPIPLSLSRRSVTVAHGGCPGWTPTSRERPALGPLYIPHGMRPPRLSMHWGLGPRSPTAASQRHSGAHAFPCPAWPGRSRAGPVRPGGLGGLWRLRLP
jgi:hypothetical protein